MLLTLLDKSDRAITLLGMFKFVAVVALVVLLAYLTTRLVSRGYMRGYNTRELEILDKLILSPDKSLALIRLKAKDKVYLVSMDKNGMRLMDSFEDFPPNSSKVSDNKLGEVKSFKDVLKSFGGDKK